MSTIERQDLYVQWLDVETGAEIVGSLLEVSYCPANRAWRMLVLCTIGKFHNVDPEIVDARGSWATLVYEVGDDDGEDEEDEG